MSNRIEKTSSVISNGLTGALGGVGLGYFISDNIFVVLLFMAIGMAVIIKNGLK